MKIVIDIPDEQYDLIRDKINSIRDEFLNKSHFVPAGWVAIADGAVLPKDEWEDYSIDFYKCPECGYLLEKCCPNCGNIVVLPVSNSGGDNESHN